MLDQETYDELRSNVRRLTEAKIKPNAAAVDENEVFPEASMAAFRSLDLLGMPYPETYGGGGGDLMTQVIVLEEVARGCASSAAILLTSWAAMCPILAHGSAALKDEIIPPIAAGKHLASFCLTEPTGGSDLAGMATKAVAVDGGWKINGQKRFISNAHHSKYYAVLAKTAEKGFGVFIVDAENEGISFGSHEKKMGMRGFPTADVILQDCFVPDRHVVGDPYKGYSYMMDTLTLTRPFVGGHAIGIAQNALDEAIFYVKERKQFGAPIAKYQMVRAMISDMMTQIEAARALLYRSVETAPINDERARAFASMAKVACSDAAMSVTTDAVQLFGGNGYMRDYPVERLMRDAKVTQIWEGTNQIQKLLISKYAFERDG